jgi:threonine dehydratase
VRPSSLEFLQHAGSFKTRGAFNSLLSRDIPPVGVVAASGGNHGAAVAFPAMKTKHPATIFVPNVASPAKLEQIRGYGARLEIAGERYNDALIASEAFVAKSGGRNPRLRPVGHARAGTVAMEFEEQAQSLDAVLRPSASGLIGGMAAWYAGRPVIGVEPKPRPRSRARWKRARPWDAGGGIAAVARAQARGSADVPIAQRRRAYGAGHR